MTVEIYDRDNNPDDLVFPGTRLGVIEEFYAGPGTTADENYIYATVAGTVIIDTQNYEISIMPKFKHSLQPKIGSICLGSVVNVSRQMVTIAISYIENKEVYPTFTCLLHISQVSKAYLDTADDAVAQGDIVRIKIIDAKTIPVQGTMAESQLGVVLGYCSRCGARSEKIGRNKLKCSECKNYDKRKTAIDYGHSNLQFKL